MSPTGVALVAFSKQFQLLNNWIFYLIKVFVYKDFLFFQRKNLPTPIRNNAITPIRKNAMTPIRNNAMSTLKKGLQSSSVRKTGTQSRSLRSAKKIPFVM